MRILILEDNAERIAQFVDNYFPENIHFVRTADRAIELLKLNPKFDVVFLDHDLGGQEMLEAGAAGTGSDVARYIAEELGPIIFPGVVVLHSINPKGRQWMLEILADNLGAARVTDFPFAWQKCVIAK